MTKQKLVDVICTEHRALGRLARTLWPVKDNTVEAAILNHRRAWGCTAGITIEEGQVMKTHKCKYCGREVYVVCYCTSS